MAKKISALTDHLFDQLDRLAKVETDSDKLEAEVRRTEAMVAAADQILAAADMQLKAAKLFAEHGSQVLPMLPMIGKATE